MDKRSLIFKKLNIVDYFEEWFLETKDEDNFEEYVGFYDHEKEKFLESFKEDFCFREDVPLSEVEKNPLFIKKYGEAEFEHIKNLANDWFLDRLADFSEELEEVGQVSEKGIICARSLMIEDVDLFYINLVNGIYLEEFSGVGVCWSWNHDKAESHWGSKGEEVILKALIPFSAIDLKRTLWLNLNPSLGEDEAEIRLLEGSSVFLISFNDEDFPKPIKVQS